MTAVPDLNPAMGLVRDALRAAVPGADPTVLAPDDVIRDVLELDSLDFLAFVEDLSARAGVGIAEDDYGRLTTLAGCAAFIEDRSRRDHDH